MKLTRLVESDVRMRKSQRDSEDAESKIASLRARARGGQVNQARLDIVKLLSDWIHDMDAGFRAAGQGSKRRFMDEEWAGMLVARLEGRPPEGLGASPHDDFFKFARKYGVLEHNDTFKSAIGQAMNVFSDKKREFLEDLIISIAG